MKLPRYPKYKDCGVEWLGEVPEHWKVDGLKRNFRLVTGRAIERSNPIGLENIESWSGCLIPSETGFEGDGTAFQRGDILFGKLRPYLAKVHLAESNGEAVGDFHVLRPNGNIQGRFLLYYLLNRDTIHVIDGSTFGAKMPRVGWEFFGNLKVPVAPVAEQYRVVAFLDTETKKIDALVAEQQRLIELLKEKRQAVISHAVTKGLNPNAPMKESGVEWLGEIPEHWQMVPLRWRSRCRSGESVATDEISEVESSEKTVPVIGGNGVMGYAENGNTVHPVLAVGRVGALCGNVHQIEPPAWVTDNALILDVSLDTFDLSFLAESLRARNLNDMAAKTAQPLITGTQVKDQRIPCPPLAEQLAIAIYLRLETTKIDLLTNEAQRGISLLQERRTALISAAVTGKIDVRVLVTEDAA